MQESLFGGLGKGVVAALAVFAQELGDELGQVFAHFAQGRHGEGDDVEAVEQVLPECAFGHEAGEVFMRGGDDAHVYFHFLRVADAAHGFFLNGAQEFHLHVQGQVGHFVEEEGAAVGVLEEAEAVLVGAGEAAFFVAEEFAFHQVFGDGAAVYGHKGAVAPLGELVDTARGLFLTGTGFAGDIHGHGGAGEFADHLPGFFDLRGAADEAGDVFGIGGRLFVGCRLELAAGGLALFLRFFVFR